MNTAPESAPEEHETANLREAVKAALMENPHWLAEDRDLNILAQSACGNVVDLEAASIKRVERRARMIADTHRKLRAVARANLAVQSQIHAAVISVLDARNPRALDDLLDGPLPARLGLDRAAVLIEGEVPPGLMAIRRAQDGLTARVIGKTRSEALGRIARGDPEIYGDDARDLRSEALIRIEVGGRPGLLALAARDPGVFAENQGTDLVHFLARVVERRLAGWAEH